MKNSKVVAILTALLFCALLIFTYHIYGSFRITVNSPATYFKLLSQNNEPAIQEPEISLSVKENTSSVSRSNQNELFDSWLAAIQQSNNFQDRLAAAYMERDLNQKLILLKSLHDSEPKDAFISYLIMDACLTAKNPAICGTIDLSLFKETHRDNGRVSDMEAIQYYRQQEKDKALNALIEAAHSSHSSEYTAEEYEVLLGSMLQHGYEKNRDTIVAATGMYAARIQTLDLELIKICKEYKASIDWHNACSLRGKSLVQTGEQFIQLPLGLTLMKIMGQQDDPVYIEAEAQGRKIRSTFREHEARFDAAMASGFSLTDSEWNEFMRIMKTAGRDSAMIYLGELIQRR